MKETRFNLYQSGRFASVMWICLSCGGQASIEEISNFDENASAGNIQNVGSGQAGAGGAATGGQARQGGSENVPSDCQSFSDTAGVVAIYDLASASSADSSSTDFFNYPWPSLQRPLSQWANLPNPVEANDCDRAAAGEVASMLRSAFEASDYRRYLYDVAGSQLDSGSNHPVVYIQFDGALNEEALPTAEESLSIKSPVFLINVDANSPNRGQLIALQSRVFNDSLYLPPNSLAAMPALGFPLEANTRYALVVRTALGDGAGVPLGQAAGLQALLDREGCPGADAGYRQAMNYLAAAHNIELNSIAATTIFDSGNPGGSLDSVRHAIEKVVDAPALAQVQITGPATAGGENHYRVTGSYTTLIQQRGTPPYLPVLTPDIASQALVVSFDSEDNSGQFLANAIATSNDVTDPNLPRTERVPFVLTLPNSELSGTERITPLVIFGPGTGGSRNSPSNNTVAERLAKLGYATVTIDPVMHAERAHTENIDATLVSQLATFDMFLGTTNVAQMTELVESGDLFFNPFQLQAARGNVLQGAVDYLWQAKVFRQLSLTVSIDGTARTLSFERVSFFGHSQGGSIGPLLAGSASISESVLSGASGHIPSVLLNKTKPVDTIDIGAMLGSIVCDNSAEPLDAFHPVMAVVGHWFENADGEHYAGRLVHAESGMSVFMIQGVGDNFSPPQGNESLATAARLNEALPAVAATAPEVQGQGLLNITTPNSGYSEKTSDLSANFQSRTGGFKQYSGSGCDDPHFVYVCNQQTINDWEVFFSTALDGPPTIP